MMKKQLLIHPEELSYKWIDRMAHFGIDTLGLHPRGGKNAYDTLMEMLEMLATPEYRSMIDYACDKKGLKIEYEFHAAGYLMPKDLFDAHPEWFRMNEYGERVPDMNFCFYNEEAMNVVEENAVRLAKQLYRSEPNYYFWLDDAKNKGCHCPLCKNESPSDCQLHVVNRIHNALRKYNKNAKTAYIAYLDTLKAPGHTKPSDGVFLEYAPIERDMHKKLEDNPPQSTGDLNTLLRLFGTENAKVLEYWYDNSLFSKWKKPPVQFTPDVPIIKADIAYYNSLGFDYISSFACFLGEDYEKLYGEPDISAF